MAFFRFQPSGTRRSVVWNLGPSFQRADKEVLFIFGAARSGTTMLHTLLRKYFRYAMGPEGTFIYHFAAKLHSYGDLDHDANLCHLIGDVSRSRMLEIMRTRRTPSIDISPHLIQRNLIEKSYAGVVYSVFECIAKMEGRTRIANKNPGYIHHLDLLDVLFPTQAKYLCIVRDGRDVAVSNMKTHWGLSSSYACAKAWVRSMESLADWRCKIGPDRLFVVKYENILDDPETALRQIQNFLAIPASEVNVEQAAAEILQETRRTYYNRWHDEMSASEIRIYEAIAGRWLATHGYLLASPKSQVTSPERLWYEGKEVFRLARVNLKAALSRQSVAP